MFNPIIYLFIFSISFLEANNFEKIDLVLSNNYTFKRIRPHDQIILKGANVEYQNISIEDEKVPFIS